MYDKYMETFTHALGFLCYKNLQHISFLWLQNSTKRSRINMKLVLIQFVLHIELDIWVFNFDNYNIVYNLSLPNHLVLLHSVIGSNIKGEVVEVGQGVWKFKPGNKIMPLVNPFASIITSYALYFSYHCPLERNTTGV